MPGSTPTFYHAAHTFIRTLPKKAHPALFAATMGTGAISGLFQAFPYAHHTAPMLAFSTAFSLFNCLLFSTSFILLLWKYTSDPSKWFKLISNPTTSQFLGCFPMGATTLINFGAQVLYGIHNFGGKPFVYFLWAMWWLDVLVSFACCWIGVHAMITRQAHSAEGMTSIWLLPVVTLIVASSTGGVLSIYLRDISPQHAIQTLSISTFMVAVGLSLALMILTLYLQRLILHGLPSGGSILSVFLPLGPTGQAGYAILLIGQNFNVVLPAGQTGVLQLATTGPLLNAVCVGIAYILWSLATMWVLYALLALYTALKQSRVPFKISFWGLVFPNGVYANLTIMLAEEFGSSAFRVWGSIYAAGTLALWVLIFLRSLVELHNMFSRCYTSSCVSETIPTTEKQAHGAATASPA